MMTYPECYNRAKELTQCQFKDGLCEANRAGCCDTCKHLEGVCAIKSLACALWICKEKRKSLPKDVISELQDIWKHAYRNNWLVCRGTAEEYGAAWNDHSNRVIVVEPSGNETSMPLSFTC